MNERALGSCIIGGIALIGVVWALIDGVPAVAKAKNEEKKLENSLVEIVNSKYSASVSKLDVRKVSYSNDILIEKNKFGVETAVYKALIALEGYTASNENFKVEIVAKQSYISDLINKVGNSSLTSEEALRYDIYQNYTMTSAKMLNDILADSSTQIKGYYLGEGTYTRLYADEGTKIVAIGDPFKANGMPNNPYNVAEVAQFTESTTSQVYVYGSIVGEIVQSEHLNTTSNTRYYTYSFDLLYEDPTSKDEFKIRVEDIALGTGITNLAVGDTVVIKSGVFVEDNKVVLKEFNVGDRTLGCLVDSLGEPQTLKTLLRDADGNVKNADYANNAGKALKYGEIASEQTYITGTVYSVTPQTDENKSVYYNIRLVTTVDDVNYYVEIYRATFDKANVLQNEINVGDVIACKGYLSANMNYQEVK